MRRGIVVLFIVVFSQFFLIAGSPSADIQVSPYSYQRIMMRSSVNYDSVYGFGGKVGINLKSTSTHGWGGI